MKGFALGLCLFVAGMLTSTTLRAQTQSSAQKPAATTHSAATRSRTSSGTDPALMHPASLTAKAPDTYEVKFSTTKGDFVVRVTRAWAPLGADRFYNLVRHRFYNDMAIFRVANGFVVQFGLGPSPAVNKVWENARIKDDAVSQSNKPGTITFATAGPNTRTTQVFINLGNNAALDSQGFAPFGEVISGMDVVQKFYSGYGETTTSDQGNITNGGKAYLEKTYPKLDVINTATITSPVPSVPAQKPAAAHKPATPQP